MTNTNSGSVDSSSGITGSFADLTFFVGFCNIRYAGCRIGGVDGWNIIIGGMREMQ